MMSSWLRLRQMSRRHSLDQPLGAFEDGSVTDRRIVKVAAGHPPKREELGDTDSSQWEINDDGKPRDPYVFQWLLPMSPVEAEGDLTVYATASKGGIGAIGLLCKVYGRSQRHGLLPIVALKTTSYKHPVYEKVLKPDLPIVAGTERRRRRKRHPTARRGTTQFPTNRCCKQLTREFSSSQETWRRKVQPEFQTCKPSPIFSAAGSAAIRCFVPARITPSSTKASA
jgi:hypothetical protein